jgi:hypothetical protein
LVLPAPTGETAAPLLVDDDEEDTKVEASDAVMRAVAELSLPLPFSTPEPVPVKGASGRPPMGAPANAGARGAPRIPPPSGSAATYAVPEVISVEAVEPPRPRRGRWWPAALATGLIGFGLGGFVFGRRGPVAPPPTVSVTAPVTISAPVPDKIVALPPPPQQPPPPPHPRKVVKLDEVVLTRRAP